jgi:RNA polymerase sigma factor (sigma-70 family)
MLHASNFWEFYKLNRKDIEAMLYGICKYYQSDKIDSEDLHQELLITLQRSNFLERFDPERSKLSTYFYGYARHRAGHVVRIMLNKIKKEVLGTPVYIDHARSNGDEGEIYEEIADVKAFTPEEYAEADDLRDKILETLKSDKVKNTLILLEKGFNRSEIADMHGMSRMNTGIQWDKIKEVAKKFLPKRKHLGEDWSCEDIRILKNLYKSRSLSQVAAEMGRSVCSIKCKIYKLHITKGKINV